MINKIIFGIFASVLLTSQQIQSDELIPAEYFACYSNYNSMQMSPNGEYIAILSQPRDNKCDIEPDLQKRVEDDYRGCKLTNSQANVNVIVSSIRGVYGTTIYTFDFMANVLC